MHCLAAPCLLGLISWLPCQATLLVGAGGYPDIQAALDDAQTGDVVRVAPGTYQGFFLNVGVTVMADVPGTVEIFPILLNLVQAPAAQPAHLVGLRFWGLLINSTTVTMDQCEVVGDLAVLSVINSDCYLQDCIVRNEQVAVIGASDGTTILDNSSVVAVGCTFETTDENQILAGAAAISLDNAHLHCSSSTLVAGIGFPSAPALLTAGTSTAWLSDCRLTSAAACATEGPGIHLDRSTLVPDCGGWQQSSLLGMRRPQPIVAGSPIAIDFTTAPGALVLLFASDALLQTTTAGIELPVLLEPTGCFTLGLVQADANGAATASVPIPAGPLPTGAQLWCQGFSWQAGHVVAGPVVGGIAR